MAAFLWLSVPLTASLSVSPSVRLSINPRDRRSVPPLHVCPFVCPSVFLSVLRFASAYLPLSLSLSVPNFVNLFLAAISF